MKEINGKNCLTTGEYSQKLGISKGTLRSYVDIGLIKSSHADSNDFLFFDQAYIEDDKLLIGQIRKLKKKPFNKRLSEVKKLLDRLGADKFKAIDLNNNSQLDQFF